MRSFFNNINIQHRKSVDTFRMAQCAVLSEYLMIFVFATGKKFMFICVCVPKTILITPLILRQTHSARKQTHSAIKKAFN